MERQEGWEQVRRFGYFQVDPYKTDEVATAIEWAGLPSLRENETISAWAARTEQERQVGRFIIERSENG